MIFVYEGGAALVLLALTLWLQCGGIAVLIIWLRTAVAGNIHRRESLHIAALIVRLMTAVIALHVIAAKLQTAQPGNDQPQAFDLGLISNACWPIFRSNSATWFSSPLFLPKPGNAYSGAC